MAIMRKIPYILVGVAQWSGPGEDSVDTVFEDMKIEMKPIGYVTLIHKSAKPSDPFFAMLSASDIIELAELIQKGEIE